MLLSPPPSNSTITHRPEVEEEEGDKEEEKRRSSPAITLTDRQTDGGMQTGLSVAVLSLPSICYCLATLARPGTTGGKKKDLQYSRFKSLPCSSRCRRCRLSRLSTLSATIVVSVTAGGHTHATHQCNMQAPALPVQVSAH